MFSCIKGRITSLESEEDRRSWKTEEEDKGRGRYKTYKRKWTNLMKIYHEEGDIPICND